MYLPHCGLNIITYENTVYRAYNTFKTDKKLLHSSPKTRKKHTSHDTRVVFVYLQLRVIRAFKSTLEDLEERRSIHSLRTTTTSSRGRPLSDNITYIDEEHHHNHNYQAVPPSNNKTPLSEG
uniref:Uncharacterized protein n=1 Tax=Sipha flava TaxID=143950 RepID=A0A2S2QBT1_9HEMI